MKQLSILFSIVLFSTISVFAQLDQICRELYIDKKSVDLDLLTSKRIRSSIKIYAIPVIVEKDEESWIGDLFLVKFDTITKKILIKTRFKHLLESNAIEIHNMWIDTAPYILQSGKRSFGIRISSSNNSRATSAEFETIFLFEEQQNDFSNILDLITKRSVYSGGGDCENTEADVYNSYLIVDKSNINSQHYNLIEKLKKESFNLTKDCEDGKKLIKNYTNIFVYENGKYKCKDRKD